MPDYSDDAQKRQRRGGVLPPFFAPRVTPRDDSSVAPSGGWRRASRLFTPPDVPRQRGAANGLPVAEPPRTTSLSAAPAESIESVVPARTAAPAVSDMAAVSEVAEVQSEAAESAVPTAPAVPTASLEAALPAAPGTGAELDAPPMATFPLGIAEGSEVEPIEDISWPTSSTSELRSTGDGSEGEGPLGVAGDDLVIQSFQSQPISLSSREPIVAADSAALALDEYYDSTDAVPSASQLESGDEPIVHLGAPWSEAEPSAPEGEPPLGDTSSELPDLRSDAPESSVDIASPSYVMPAPLPAAPVSSLEPAAWSSDSLTSPDAMPDVTGVAPAESSGVQGSGQGVWGTVGGAESAGSETDVPERAREVSDVMDEVPDDSAGEMSDRVGHVTPERVADEMADALAWDDDAESELDPTHHSVAHPGSFAGDGEALSGTGRELRDSAAPWIPEMGSAADDSVPPFHYPRTPLWAPGEATEVSGDSLDRGAPAGRSEERDDNAGARSANDASVPVPLTEAVGAVGDAGAAVADALARVAERIRAGEVKLSPEAAGASDEGALVAALAALLRRAPRG